MPHRSASTRRDQFCETVKCDATILPQVASRQGPPLRACQPRMQIVQLRRQPAWAMAGRHVE
jgi:hypothetical protein